MPANRPNILWIMTDEQRVDSLGCYGNAWAQTPNVDALARRGVRMNRAYVQNPICVPSRGSILTGRYCRCLGMMQNGDSLGHDEVTLTRVLNAQGYATANFGKVHLGGGPHGFMQHDATGDRSGVSPYEAPNAADGFPVRAVTDQISPAVIVSGTYPGRVEDHEAYVRTQGGIDFLAAAPAEPFMLRVSLLSPHTPVLAPAPYDELHDPAAMPIVDIDDDELATKPSPQRRYCDYYRVRELADEDRRLWMAHYHGLASFVDAQIGRMIDALDRSGMADNTIVALCSDHGCMVGDKGMVTKGPFDYEPTNRVPFILCAPWELPQGEVCEDLVELVDFMPTLLDLCRIPIPDTVQGRSLGPRLRGDARGHRDAVFSEGDGINLDGLQPPPREPRCAVRTERYKLVHFPQLGEGELYDLEADPQERVNRFDDSAYAVVRRQLLDRLADWHRRF